MVWIEQQFQRNYFSLMIQQLFKSKETFEKGANLPVSQKRCVEVLI